MCVTATAPPARSAPHSDGPLFVLRLTALLILLHGASTWALDVAVRVIAGAMLVAPPLLVRPALWLSLTGCLLIMNGAEWFWIDNHKFLMTYWCIACTVAVASSRQAHVLEVNARVLIGLTFALATAWKLLAGQYHNGLFWHQTLLMDPRVEWVTDVVGGLSMEQLAHNRAAIAAMTWFPREGVALDLASTNGVRVLAWAMSYWTLLIEGAVAWAFLRRREDPVSRHRDHVLLLFLVTTFGVLQVTGFAFVLAVMGLAQCRVERSGVWVGYCIALVLVQLTGGPWRQIVEGLVG